MKKFLILCCFFPALCLTAQSERPSLENALAHFDFMEQRVIDGKDTLTYYLKKYRTKPKHLVVFIQGTDANPIFSFSNKNGKTTYIRWFGDDYQQLDPSYAFAIVPKPAMDGLFEEGKIAVPQAYHEKNHLDYRVKQLDRSIDHIVANHLSEPERIIVYGHSEGAVIGAALATKNPSITHLGFWSGNVLNNFYEFALFNRIEAQQGTLTDEQAHENVLGILNWYRSVIQNPEATEIDHFGFTNKRWATYEKAPIDYLLEVDIPIYALFATEDESTPIETAYLLPVKFIEHRKKNLTFKVCLGGDHGYRISTAEGQRSLWSEQFLNFMEWTTKSSTESHTNR